MEMIERRRRMMLNGAHLKAASGAIIDINGAVRSKAKSVTVSMTQKRDLHGYAEPWLGGEGKNIFDKDSSVFVEGYFISDDNRVVKQSSYQYTETYIEVKPNTTYTVQFTKSSTETGFTIPIYTESKEFIERLVAIDSGVSGFNSGTFTTTAETKYIRFSVFNSYDTVASIQIEEGTTTSPYEPFENFCPIYGLSSIKLNRTCRNIFDFNNSEFVRQEYYNANGVIKELTSYRRLVNYIEVKPNTTYTVQYVKTYNTSTGFTVPLYDENKNFIQREVPISAGSTTGLKTGQFTTTATTKYIRFSMTNVTEDVATVQIEEGSTLHDYEPFGTMYEVTFPAQGKNLLDKNNATIFNRYVTEAESWSWSGTNDSASIAFKCEPNTDYVITAINEDITIFRTAYITVDELPSTTTTGAIAGYSATRTTSQGSIQMHTGSDATYIVVQVNKAYMSDTLIQIEKGTTASRYEPYTNIVYDGTLNLTTGILSVSKYMYTLTGNEPWSYSWGTTGSNGVARWNDIPVLPNKNNNFIANFGVYHAVTSSTNIHGVYMSRSGEYLNIRTNMLERLNGRTTTEVVAEWKAFLAQRYADGKPLQILVNLAEPVLYQLTPQEVRLLTGQNTIWSNADNCDLIYYGH